MEPTRKAVPRTARHEDITKLLPWQQQLKDELFEVPDERTIRWFSDKSGGAGKSIFARHMLLQPDFDALVLTGGSKTETIKMLAAYRKTHKKEPRAVIFDLSRSQGNKISYEMLESLKDGIVVFPNGRIWCCKEKIHVVVFASMTPKMDAVSLDRWNITEL